MKWLIRGYAAVLLAYTGWRTFDLMRANLPDTDASVWLALLFLFAAEVGLALWHEVSISHTSTYNQHYIAIGLTWLDFVGSLVAGIGDMILRQTLVADYAIPTLIATAVIYGLPLIVAANVAGALIYLSNDAESVSDREKRFLDFEAHRQAVKQLSEHRRNLVIEKKRQIYEEIAGTITQAPAQARKPKIRIPRNGRQKSDIPLWENEKDPDGSG